MYDVSVVTLTRTDTTLDHSQKAEKVCVALPSEGHDAPKIRADVVGEKKCDLRKGIDHAKPNGRWEPRERELPFKKSCCKRRRTAFQGFTDLGVQ